MDKSRLHYCARQILIHWLQSKAPLERMVANVFKEMSLGPSERKEIQSRIFLWARYWPVFGEGLNIDKIDSSVELVKLFQKIEDYWDLNPKKWSQLHEKKSPQFEDNPRAHLLNVHGCHPDLLSFIREDHSGFFHQYLHSSMTEAPLAIRCRNLKVAEQIIKKYPELKFKQSLVSELCLKTQFRWAAILSDEYKNGDFEIQDESSQIVSIFSQVKPGMRILDMCSGAGGKSLHLANLMEGRGEVHCWDPSHKKLSELQKRARRWNFSNVRCLTEAPKTSKFYDLVLVDAPCSSLGTLRRRPQLLSTTSMQELIRLRGLQRELILRGLELSHSSGVLVYATCSVLPTENIAQVQSGQGTPYPIEDSDLKDRLFKLKESPGAKISTIEDQDFASWCIQISAHDEFSGDGFFVARMKP